MKTIAKILVVPVLAAFIATGVIAAPATTTKGKTKTKTVASGKMAGKTHGKTTKGHKGGKKGHKGGKKAGAKKMSAVTRQTRVLTASATTPRAMHFHKIIRHRKHHRKHHLIIRHKKK